MSVLRTMQRKLMHPPCVLCGSPTRYKSKKEGFKCYKCYKRTRV